MLSVIALLRETLEIFMYYWENIYILLCKYYYVFNLIEPYKGKWMYFNFHVFYLFLFLLFWFVYMFIFSLHVT